MNRRSRFNSNETKFVSKSLCQKIYPPYKGGIYFDTNVTADINLIQI